MDACRRWLDRCRGAKHFQAVERYLSVKEIPYQGDHLVGPILQGEMSGRKEVKFHIGEIPLIRMCTVHQEEGKTLYLSIGIELGLFAGGLQLVLH